MRIDGAGELKAGEIQANHSGFICVAGNADPVAGR